MPSPFSPASLATKHLLILKSVGKIYLGAHINKMVDSSRKTVSWILRVLRNRSKAVIIQLYESLIRSKLEYCFPLWDPWQDIQTIEDVQLHFTYRISGMFQTYW